MEQIHVRIQKRLTALGMGRKELADRTDTPERTIEGWLQGRTKKVPASWVAAAVPVLKVNPLWLLRNEGPEELVEPEKVAVRLEVVGRLVAGDYGDAIVQELANLPEVIPEELGDAVVEGLRRSLGLLPPAAGGPSGPDQP